MTDHDEGTTLDTVAPLTPRAGADLSTLYEEMSQDPDITDDDLAVRAQLSRYGEHVRAARKRKGLTQKQLSTMARITQARISMIESGTMDEGPTFRTMARLERVLGVEAMPADDDTAGQILVDPAVFSLSEDERSEVLSAAVKRRDMASASETEPAVPRHPIGVRAVNLQENDVPTTFEVATIDNVAASFPQGCIPISGFVREIAMATGCASALNATPNYVVLRRDPEDKYFAVSVIP